MKNLTMLCISLFISSHSLACEPASLNWEQFHKTYDLNKNKTFELKEILSVKDFDPLPWPDDKRFQAKDKNFKLFKYLDKNKDGKLADEELGEIHSLLPNPCANWPPR